MKALYAGSFDPFTNGHLDISMRAFKTFGNLTIGIGVNKEKKCFLSPEERESGIKRLFSNLAVEVDVVTFSGLTVDFAKKIGAGILVRGLRNQIDFEAEKNLAEINKSLSGIDTAFFLSPPELSFVSSSMVREMIEFGVNVDKYVPGPILRN